MTNTTTNLFWGFRGDNKAIFIQQITVYFLHHSTSYDTNKTHVLILLSNLTV